MENCPPPQPWFQQDWVRANFHPSTMTRGAGSILSSPCSDISWKEQTAVHPFPNRWKPAVLQQPVRAASVELDRELLFLSLPSGSTCWSLLIGLTRELVSHPRVAEAVSGLITPPVGSAEPGGSLSFHPHLAVVRPHNTRQSSSTWGSLTSRVSSELSGSCSPSQPAAWGGANQHCLLSWRQ